MTLDEAEALQRAYHDARFVYVHDPVNQLAPWPKPVGRPPKRKPFPGVIDLAEEDAG
jgi:hypothetical protein